MIEVVVMMLDDNIVAVDNSYPLVLHAHLNKFIQLIENKIVIVGSTTYEELGENPFSVAKKTVVISRHKKYQKVKNASSIIEVMELYKDFIVIGGHTIFTDFLPVADKVYVTEVHKYPEFKNSVKKLYKLNNFSLVNESEVLRENEITYRFLEYEKR
jgi:dihydrofolate reductase